MIVEVEQAKTRSQMPVLESLRILGIARRTYYRWRRERAWEQERRQPLKPVQVFEALPAEKAAVKSYALAHPEIRHRELAWRMIDEDVAYLSSSTVYRILCEQDLMCRRPGRRKRYREEHEKAAFPDHIWGTDFMYLKIGKEQYFLIAFIDEYSRYLVHWELMSTMDGNRISTAAQAALETLPRDAEGKVLVQPIIRSDNGSGYVSKEFGGLLEFHGLNHHRIRPHCPEENGIMERANRTLRESIDEHEIKSRYDAEEALRNIIDHYNHQRLHSALNYKAPVVYYRGDPDQIDEQRRRKLSQARHRRKQTNLGTRQPTLPMNSPDSAA
ncbi:MAG: IS3 family transposase [Planctomycetales bacterium]|nr:IS3 family transposase [Planctomycetales bacterium]